MCTYTYILHIHTYIIYVYTPTHIYIYTHISIYLYNSRSPILGYISKRIEELKLVFQRDVSTPRCIVHCITTLNIQDVETT